MVRLERQNLAAHDFRDDGCLLSIAPAAVENVRNPFKTDVAGEGDALAVQLHRIDHRIEAVSRNKDGLDTHSAQLDFRLIAGPFERQRLIDR